MRLNRRQLPQTPLIPTSLPMYLERLLQINMATLAALGAVLLGMGQRAGPPLLVALAAAVSVWLTDIPAGSASVGARPMC